MFQNPYDYAAVISSPRLAEGTLDQYRPKDTTLKLRRQVQSPDKRHYEVDELQNFEWKPKAVGPARVVHVREISSSRPSTSQGNRPNERKHNNAHTKLW